MKIKRPLKIIISTRLNASLKKQLQPVCVLPRGPSTPMSPNSRAEHLDQAICLPVCPSAIASGQPRRPRRHMPTDACTPLCAGLCAWASGCRHGPGRGRGVLMDTSPLGCGGGVHAGTLIWYLLLGLEQSTARTWQHLPDGLCLSHAHVCTPCVPAPARHSPRRRFILVGPVRPVPARPAIPGEASPREDSPPSPPPPLAIPEKHFVPLNSRTSSQHALTRTVGGFIVGRSGVTQTRTGVPRLNPHLPPTG